MNDIDKIKTLKKFITQKGNCAGIGCYSCAVALLDIHNIMPCEELHRKSGCPGTRLSNEKDASFMSFVKRRLIEVLIENRDR